MTWRPIPLSELRPMQTVRVNGRLAVRVHALRSLGAGLVQVETDLGEILALTAADQLLRLERAPVSQRPQADGEAPPSSAASAAGAAGRPVR